MITYCKNCQQFVTWDFVGTFTDDRNRAWEVYECPEGQHRTQYAVG